MVNEAVSFAFALALNHGSHELPEQYQTFGVGKRITFTVDQAVDFKRRTVISRFGKAHD